MIGYGVFVLAVAAFLKNKFRFVKSSQKKTLFHYGSYAILGAISGFLFNGVDKFFVHNYLGSSVLGIYSAYFTASIALAGQLGVIVANILFPVVATFDGDRQKLLKKINVSFLYFSPIVFGAHATVLWLALHLFGKSYPVSYLHLTEFSLVALMFLYFNVLWWFIAAKGRSGILFTSIHGIISGLLFVLALSFGRNTLTLSDLPVFWALALLYGIFAGNYYVFRYDSNK